MAFIYEDDELELEFKGTVYKFRAPSALEEQQLGEDFKKEDADGVKIYCEFFEKLGLPKDVLSTMSRRGLIALLEYSIGTKKN